MTHTRHIVLLASLATHLAACGTEPAAQDGLCGDSANASSPYGLHIEASLRSASWDGDADVGSTSDAMVDCATYSISKVGSDWQSLGGTPADVDLAPGTYLVEADWVHNDCVYTSEPVEVEITDGYADVHLPLCTDLGGSWTCSMGGEEWEEEAHMVEGCSVELERSGLTGRVRGHLFEGDSLSGVIGPRGRELRGSLAQQGELSCWRSE